MRFAFFSMVSVSICLKSEFLDIKITLENARTKTRVKAVCLAHIYIIRFGRRRICPVLVLPLVLPRWVKTNNKVCARVHMSNNPTFGKSRSQTVFSNDYVTNPLIDACKSKKKLEQKKIAVPNVCLKTGRFIRTRRIKKP